MGATYSTWYGHGKKEKLVLCFLCRDLCSEVMLLETRPKAQRHILDIPWLMCIVWHRLSPITWASNYTYLARSWEKHKPFKHRGKAERKSIKVFCCFKEDWCMWWWQSFEAYAQESLTSFNTLGYIQTTSSFGKW